MDIPILVGKQKVVSNHNLLSCIDLSHFPISNTVSNISLYHQCIYPLYIRLSYTLYTSIYSFSLSKKGRNSRNTVYRIRSYDFLPHALPFLSYCAVVSWSKI